MRKILLAILSLAAVMMLTTATVSAKPNFLGDGVKDDLSAAKYLQSQGLLQGNESGDLMLEDELTREQMMVIISRLMGKESEAKSFSVNSLTFNDVPKNSYYAPYIAWAKANSITQGYAPGRFGFGDKLTYWQTEAFIIRILGKIDVEDQMVTMEFSDSIFGNDPSGTGANSFESLNEEGADSFIQRKVVSTYMYFALYANTTDGQMLGKKLGVIKPDAKYKDYIGEWKTQVKNEKIALKFDTIKNGYVTGSIWSNKIERPNYFTGGTFDGKIENNKISFEYIAPSLSKGKGVLSLQGDKVTAELKITYKYPEDTWLMPEGTFTFTK